MHCRFVRWVMLQLIVWSAPYIFNTRPSCAQILVSDSSVGYIDNAVIGNQLRFRFDAVYGNVKPSRAEFFWPVAGQFGPGPGPETSVDYQDFSTYVEVAASPCFSIFGELPFRVIDPQLQDNTGGLADSNVGVKYALLCTSDSIATLQLRTYIPSGNGSRGLGNDHVTLEPGFLVHRRLSPRLAMDGELRVWIPIDGTKNFAGNVIRYGLGTSYRLVDSNDCRLTGVLEVVGWTVLDGQTAVTISPGNTLIENAAGDTIVNVKIGVRWGISSCLDLYAGYGRVLTDETWYDDVFRIELRRRF